jgi:hypothetical protein
MVELIVVEDKVRSGPLLARVARDYLAIQGSSTASERAFSSGALTGSKLRNLLAPKTFEALQLLKSGYRNGYISAAQQAEEHITSLKSALDNLCLGYDSDDEDN